MISTRTHRFRGRAQAASPRLHLKRSVRVEITDPADPAPYWLLSTRHPDRLARAIAGLHSVQ